jgi:Protein of unknown function (DUF3667)
LAPAIPCPSCGAIIEGGFCAACGERSPHPDDLSVRRFVQQTVEGLTNLDGKAPRSCLLLLTRPGFLASEFVRGARNRYVRPISLFLVANAAYYLIQPLTNINTFRTTLALQALQIHGRLATRMIDAEIARRGGDAAAYGAAYDMRSESLSKLLLFVFVPALALVFAAVSRGRSRPLGEHIVFALHFMAFVLLYVCLVAMPLEHWVLARMLPASWRDEGVMSAITFVLITVYLVFGFRHLQGGSWGTALLKAALAGIGFSAILFAYRAILFFVSFYTL